MSERDILLTGFPSFVARRLMQVIAEREPKAYVRLLVRPDYIDEAERQIASMKLSHDHVEVLSGDVVSMDLGLSGREYLDVVANVTDVYHMHKPVYNCGRGFDSVAWVRGQEYDPWVVDDRQVDIGKWHRLMGDDSDALWQPRFEQYMKNRDHFSKEEDWFPPRVTQEAIRWLDDTVKSKGIKEIESETRRLRSQGNDNNLRDLVTSQSNQATAGGSTTPRSRNAATARAPVPKASELASLAPREHKDYIGENKKNAALLATMKRVNAGQQRAHTAATDGTFAILAELEGVSLSAMLSRCIEAGLIRLGLSSATATAVGESSQ